MGGRKEGTRKEKRVEKKRNGGVKERKGRKRRQMKEENVSEVKRDRRGGKKEM